MGQCVALSLVGALEWIIVGLSDWDSEVRKAAERLREDEVGGDYVAGDYHY